MDFFYSISERYLFPSEDDFAGTIGDENEWIFEKFTDRRLRWVYIFTDEDYDRPKPCTTNVWPISEMAKSSSRIL